MGSEVVSGPGGGVLSAAYQRTEGLSPAFGRILPDAEWVWEFGANGGDRLRRARKWGNQTAARHAGDFDQSFARWIAAGED
jgi:hypothetical protein